MNNMGVCDRCWDETPDDWERCAVCWYVETGYFPFGQTPAEFDPVEWEDDTRSEVEW